MSSVILGLWPIAGITSPGVTKASGYETVQVAIDEGVNTFDTAYSYGFDGESDRLLGEVLRRPGNQSLSLSVIGKVGQRWTPARTRVIDGTAKQLTADAEASLERIGIDRFDLLMLHAVDPHVAIEQSAEAIDSIRRRGLADRVGVCTLDAFELRRFADVCPCSALQCPLNLLQPSSLDPLIQVAADSSIDVHVYWTLMKGLLAGGITREHTFEVGDSRHKYEIFQGDARARAHRVLDQLAVIAREHETTVALLSIGWALSQSGVSAALVGAKLAGQIRETAHASRLPPDVIEQMNRVVSDVMREDR